MQDNESLNVSEQPKRLKIVVGINSLVSTTQPAYSNHVQLFFRLGRSYPHIDFFFWNPGRMSIDRMRNSASKIAMDLEADYLWFIDDDVLIPFTALASLLSADSDAVSGNVIIRGYPFNYMLFRRQPDGNMPQMTDLPTDEGPVISVDALGFSCTLIKVSLLKKIPLPHFVTGISNTEDIYFFLKAKEVVPDLTIKADLTVICHHILWEEFISDSNRTEYRKYFETTHPEVIKALKQEEIDNKDRGNEYLEEVEALLVKNAQA